MFLSLLAILLETAASMAITSHPTAKSSPSPPPKQASLELLPAYSLPKLPCLWTHPHHLPSASSQHGHSCHYFVNEERGSGR